MRKTTRVAKLSALALLTVCGAAAQAQTTVYKCVDKAGRVEFTDVSKPGCKALDLPGYISTPVPAPKSTPAVTMRQGAGRPATASPSNFPRVDNATQRARDDDRREILNEELRAEEKKLADLRRDFNNGEPERQGNEKNYAKYQERVAQMRDDIGRAEKNIEALRREIANIR
jgi:HAMP domain-containing protein